MTLLTGEGYWSPLLWLAAAAGVVLLSLLIWSRGRKGYNRATEQDLPFLSGEKREGVHVGGGHLYWGFVEGLRPYVERLRLVHSGFVGDYVAWLVVMLAVVFLIVLLGG
ncbi:MAG TPA: hydrogenase [Candidatus Bipolaricaulis sp.]|nr:hydrogenase [Candidatus Bipolaricaulis sp.]MDY0392291.1 hydrogenase [Candidatus Bipolaricaulis sp.]HPD06453.1 hydrogenase [Candidatus Bipolaricaulis sp.]HRS14077.1 hydrogenase [Candidatus Bipolaricaulis sp.]HRU21850.1 hydrogenase [Candidatus Bipolaricaulis sp.]